MSQKVISFLNKLARFTEELSDPSNRFYNSFMEFVGQDMLRTLQIGIEEGIDIDGNRFEPLSDVTLKIRRLRGNSSDTPMLNTGALSSGMKAVVTGTQVRLQSYPEYEDYGKYHNEGGFNVSHGFYPSGKQKRGFYAVEGKKDFFNLEGKRVPERKFYGIPESYKPGGNVRESLNRTLVNGIREGLNFRLSTDKSLPKKWWKDFKRREIAL